LYCRNILWTNTTWQNKRSRWKHNGISTRKW
jgi:hypothetical protein